jgi:hypothetical protein
MRPCWCLWVAATLVFTSTHPGAADDLPNRRAGLWESVSSRNDGAPPQTAKQCIDDKTDSLVRAATANPNCAQTSVARTTAGYEVQTDCKFGAMSASCACHFRVSRYAITF